MKKSTGLIITILFLAVGVFVFIGTDGVSKQQRESGKIYSDMQIKTGYLDGSIKLFALADPSVLKAYPTTEGNNIPSESSMILGFDEAQMMKDEKLISGVGSSFDDFFGIKTAVGGILELSDSPLDDMHFLSSVQFAAIKGEENRVFVIRSPEGMGKLFYVKPIEGSIPLELELNEGDLTNYKTHSINGKDYAPLIVGSKEAKMMRSEKLFSGPGDTITGFFGQDVYVVGVLDETKTALDMMHISPLSREDYSN